MIGLKPCRLCGADCRAEVFGPNKAIEGTLTAFMCSNSTLFGGTCEADAYLSEDYWAAQGEDA